MNINFICLKWGTKYPSKYVNILYNMVSRNLSKPFRFVCLTENDKGLDKNINALPLLCDHTKVTGWWQKLSIFQNKVYDLSGPTIFLDLDLVIVNSLDCFINYSGNFCIIQDWHFAKKNVKMYNSSVFKFEIGSQTQLWEKFIRNPETIVNKYPGDQDYITDEIKDATYWPEKWCISYKWHQAWKGFDDDTRVIVFHGRPNPDEVIHTGYKKFPPSPWVANFWR